MPLYPLRFEPIFKNYLWGGRRLAEWLPTAPAAGPIAEAWLVSDEPDNPSVVADGPLKGKTLGALVRQFGPQLLGTQPARNERFPLLLKFLDAATPLSVQVHPTDDQAARTNPAAQGKTEAWVVLRAEAASRIYAGLKQAVDATRIRQALADKTLPDCLHAFLPQAGDCVFLPAGTVHALGAGLLIFEVQQTSDITYRLYDWDRIDEKTGKGRTLHVEEAIACTNFSAGPGQPVRPTMESGTVVPRERLVNCRYFRLWRLSASGPFPVGAPGECRIVVGVHGASNIHVAGQEHRLNAGEVLLLPAAVGEGLCIPQGKVIVLECGLPA